MGYLSCNAESAIATCDSHYWDLKKNRTTPKTHRNFHYSDLLSATNGFSADCFLGKGSHGSVYRATLDGGNLIAAVKITNFSKPSATSQTENEIEILSRVRNPRRFVNLIGYCSHNHYHLIVVDYMPNGSLYDALHSTTTPPGWSRRLRFASQVAKAVHSLHSSNPPVIHRDIKSSNVLIDEKGRARLGDFGLALRGHVEDVRVKCTPPAGTLGYLDPCYLAPGDLSAKSDVFSFGILLLEIISGRKAIDLNYSPPSVVDWAVPLIKRGEIASICDRRIGRPSDRAAIWQLSVVAAKCVRSRAEKRPSMGEVVEWVEQVRRRPIWNGLRRRMVGRQEQDNVEQVCERNRMMVKVGSRRNGKVSSVEGVQYHQNQSKCSNSNSNGNGNGNRIRSRSRSMSCGGDADQNNRLMDEWDPNPNVRLNKSRSLGGLQGQRLNA